ncbi:MAG TPA: GNAT family N-acetyltransferase [Alphaproteobacteria bacterium]|nr:GNAT family N-acetyltransferase [Alphaproteobacteria bacterium]
MREYAIQQFGRWDAEKTRSSFDAKNHAIIQRDGADIGVVATRHEPAHVFIEKLYIAPNHQNRGAGAAVLNLLADDAERTSRGLRLSVLRVNPARRFYERNGFVVTEVTDERYFMERLPNSRS